MQLKDRLLWKQPQQMLRYNAHSKNNNKKDCLEDDGDPLQLH